MTIVEDFPWNSGSSYMFQNVSSRSHDNQHFMKIFLGSIPPHINFALWKGFIIIVRWGCFETPPGFSIKFSRSMPDIRIKGNPLQTFHSDSIYSPSKKLTCCSHITKIISTVPINYLSWSRKLMIQANFGIFGSPILRVFKIPSDRRFSLVVNTPAPGQEDFSHVPVGLTSAVQSTFLPVPCFNTLWSVLYQSGGCNRFTDSLSKSSGFRSHW